MFPQLSLLCVHPPGVGRIKRFIHGGSVGSLSYAGKILAAKLCESAFRACFISGSFPMALSVTSTSMAKAVY